MANKYIRHGETYCGDGTTSAVATSNGSAGAWNNINVLEGTAPAYGALAVGDVVYIRSKDAGGADIIRTLTSGTITYLGQAAATANAPTTWILDDGTVWSGANGKLSYQNSSNTNRISFRANNFFKSAANKLEYKTTQTSGSASDGQPWMEVYGVVEGIYFDTTLYTNTSPTHQIFFGDGGTLINPILKLGALSIYTDASRSYCFFGAGISRCDLFLINPDIELTNATSLIGQGFFSVAAEYGKNTYVYGGRIYGTGTNVTNQFLIGLPPSGHSAGMVKLVGFQFPRSMKVTDGRIYPTQSNSTGGSFIEIIGCDDGIGGHHEACWGWMTSRTDNNPPYLSASGLDSNNTPWAWRVYPGYTDLRSPMQIPIVKMYTGAAAVKTISLEVLIANTFSVAKDSMWITVNYVDSSGVPRCENTRAFGALDASTAAWSTTVWGMIGLVKNKFSLTTAYSIRQNSVITVTLFGYAKSASANDILFVDPDFGVN